MRYEILKLWNISHLPQHDIEYYLNRILYVYILPVESHVYVFSLFILFLSSENLDFVVTSLNGKQRV